MNKLTKVITGVAAASGLLFVSCKSSSEFEGYTKSESGLYFKLVKHDEKGEKPKEGDLLNMAFRFILMKNDSVYIDSKKVSRDGSAFLQIPLYKKTFKGCIEEGLAMLTKGDSASFIISADSFFLKTQKATELPPFVKPGDKMMVNISLKDFKTQQQVQLEQEEQMKKFQEEEKTNIARYIGEHGITTPPTASGLYIIEKEKGKGKKIAKGDEAVVKYKGMLLDGTVFDTSEGKPEAFSFPVGEGRVIAGWDEALLTMTVGTKATLLIPSDLGYGPNGMGQAIPPYAPLVFEIEVSGIKDNAKK